jgi:sugar lactone lactonase YvrE
MPTHARRLLALSLCALAACARVPEEPPRPPILYPPPPDAPRVQYLTSIRAVTDMPRASSPLADLVLGPPEEGMRVWKPYGVAMQGTRLFICDTIINNVLIFDFADGSARSLSTNLGADILRNPINIAVATDGTKYVADALRGQVVVFGPDDRYQTAWGTPEEMTPCDVLVVGNRLAVADLLDDEIEIWDRRTGERLSAFGGPGSGPGQFRAPTNLALSPDGTLCVSETHGFRVQRLTLEGDPLLTFGGIGTGFGQFTRPKGVAVDPAGRICVVDSAFANVQIFTDSGELLMFFGGGGPDVSNLDLPADVEIVTDPASLALFEPFVAPGRRISHLFLVSSQFGVPRINVYGFLDEGETPVDRARPVP